MHSDRGRRDKTIPTQYLTTILLDDVDMDDHGFVYMSKSHKYHDRFFDKHPKGSLHFESTTDSTGTVQLTFDEMEYFEKRGCHWRKVVAPKDSVIVWDTRLIHCTSNPRKGRLNPQNRYLIYGGWEPATSR